MNKETIIIKDNAAYADEADFAESEQIWRFAGDYYLLFNRKKWLILFFCVLGAAAGLTYALLKNKKYVAEVKFTSNIDNESSGYLSIAQQFGLISGGGGGSAFSGDNLMSLMKTPSLINQTFFTRVIINNRPVLFVDYYIQSKKLKQKWAEEESPLLSATFNPDLSKPDYLRDGFLKSADYEISKELTIDKSEKDLSFISVKMTDEDSVITKLFTETLVKTVTDYYVAITTAKYSENVKVFQAKADSLSRNFGQRISSIASAQDININPSRQIANVPIQKQQMNAQVDNAVYQEVIKNLELSKIQLQKETPFIQIIETPRYPLDQIQTSKSTSALIGFVLGGVAILAFIFARKELVKLTRKLNAYGRE